MEIGLLHIVQQCAGLFGKSSDGGKRHLLELLQDTAGGPRATTAAQALCTSARQALVDLHIGKLGKQRPMVACRSWRCS
eukprot:5429920-Amphidinium_carterae.1